MHLAPGCSPLLVLNAVSPRPLALDFGNGVGMPGPCNPVSPEDTAGYSPCGVGVTCDPPIYNSGPAFCCTSSGTGTQGSTCSGSCGCGPGYGCRKDMSWSQCEHWCKTNADCPTGTCDVGGGLQGYDGTTPVYGCVL